MVTSCLKNPKRPVENKTTATHTTEGKKMEREVVGDNIVYHVNLSKTPAHIEESIDNEHQKITLLFNSKNKKYLKGHINAPQGMNVRFNNVLKDGKSIDGPFGQDIDYELSKDGDYGVVIGKSLMASGEDKGKIVVDLELL